MDFYNERNVKKTRKEHRCFGCMEKLPSGSTCFYISGMYEESFRAYYLCPKCRNYLGDKPDVTSEGDIGDWIKEDEEWKKERYKIL